MSDDIETAEKNDFKELAQIRAREAFPNNPRAAELLVKRTLGYASSSESQELNDYIRRRNFTEETDALWEQAKAGNPNVIKVDMGEGKAIKVEAGDEEKVIFTTGLNGCLGTLIYAEDSEGTRTTVITHYDSLDTTRNLTRIDELLTEHPSISNSPIKQVLFEVPGYKQKDGSVTHTKSTDDMTGQVEAKLQDRLGAVQIRKEPYIVTQEPEARDAGVFVVTVPPISKAKPLYRTWFSKGKLG